MKITSRMLLCWLTALLCAACFTQPDCIVTATMEIKMDFKQNKLNSDNTRSVVDTVLTFHEIRITVAGKDSLFAKDPASTSTLTLPIDPNQPTMKYTFVRKGRQANSPMVTESITFSFESESQIISAECGAFVYFYNLQVAESPSYGPSSYKIVNDRLQKDITNVQIFF